MKERIYKYVPLVIILLLAILFRFLYLDNIPNAVSGDELHYVLTAKSVYLSGDDLSGTWNPWSLIWFRYPPDEHQAELPYLLHLLVSARYPFSMFLIKLPFATLSVCAVLLLYAIAFELFGATAAAATGIIAAVNPWLVIMGRAGYEATPAMFFYLLSLWMILKVKGWKITWTAVPLLLAFYSYIGTKVILLPFTGLISWLAYVKNNKKFSRQYILLTSLSALAILAFYFLVKTDPSGSRLNELFIPNSPTVVHDVNAMRSTTMASPLMSVMINKYSIYLETMFNKLFRIFSPTYLFVEGDEFFLPVRQGFFYYLDALFVLLGAVYVGVKRRQYGSIFVLLALTGALPQIVSTTTGDFSIHLTLLFPILILVAGAGAAWTLSMLPKKFLTLGILACALLYGLNVAGFSLTYFYRSPLIGYADFPKRILTKYLTLSASRHVPVIVYTPLPSDTFKKYLLYADAITKENMPILKNFVFAQEIEFNGIGFFPCQSKNPVASGTTVITDALCGNPINAHHQSITTLTDGGENYIIEQDLVCNTYGLKRYPSDISVSDFVIERMPERQFCEIYISQR